MLTTFSSFVMSLTYDPASAAALLKIALVLVTGLSVHLSLSPPNPPAPPKHCIARKTLFERCIRWVTFCSKMMVWIETVFDALATAVAAFPSLPFAPLLAPLLCPSRSPALTSPSPFLVLGMLVTLAGALIRMTCFYTLGPLFTFELAITPTHSLVMTGPYAFVRHPSYTGVYFTLLGSSVVALAPGSWLRECWLQLGSCSTQLNSFGLGVDARAAPLADAVGGACQRSFGVGTFVAWFALGFWMVKVAYALRSTNHRLATEDSELRRAFGPVWEAYAEKVRYRLVPGIY